MSSGILVGIATVDDDELVDDVTELVLYQRSKLFRHDTDNNKLGGQLLGTIQYS